MLELISFLKQLPMEEGMPSRTQSDKNVKQEETPSEEVKELSTLEKANKITNNFVLWSAGGSIIPLPALDIAAIYASQVTMIAKMSKVYGISFSEHKFKNVLTPLFSALGVVPITTGVFASAVKFIPGIGNLVSSLSLPVMAGAITYATGKVFTAHFEAGGTLLDFNPETMKEYYKNLFEEGKTVAKETAAT